MAFRVFVALLGHWGWDLVTFTALVVFTRRSGWPSFKFLFLFVLFFFFVAWRGVA